MYRYFKKSALYAAHKIGILRGLHYLDGASVNSLYVLAYHRVDWENSQPRLDPQNLSASPEQFDQHMRLISSEYRPVSAEDLLDTVLHHKKLPPRSVLVTVDDGYLDFKKYIWPIANRYGVRPVLFVPTAYVGKDSFWWDRLYDALQRTALHQVETPVGPLPLNTLQDRHYAFIKLADYMKKSSYEKAFVEIIDLCENLVPDQPWKDKITLDWDDLRELALAGVTIAPHTHRHTALGNISPEQAKIDILESQRLITLEIGSHSMLFAYPYGSRSAIGTVAGEILRDLGYHFAFTMSPGRANLDLDDPMYLPRIPIYPKLSIAQLHAKLTPIVDLPTRKS
jgi:peptidoglycan/xylan/chitin deacetylase (PgdA/CDA1 family)